MAKKRSLSKAKPRSASPEDVVARLRELCLALPEASERTSHGEPTWFAGKGKVFAMFDNHHHGAPHLGVWLPQPLGVQETLIDADPDVFFRPPYVGPRGWVGVVLDVDPDWTMVTRLLQDAYVHVASRTLVNRLAQTREARPASSPPGRTRSKTSR
jgi:hypothetical protein